MLLSPHGKIPFHLSEVRNKGGAQYTGAIKITATPSDIGGHRIIVRKLRQSRSLESPWFPALSKGGATLF